MYTHYPIIKALYIYIYTHIDDGYIPTTIHFCILKASPRGFLARASNFALASMSA